jgi:transmembrane sensor
MAAAGGGDHAADSARREAAAWMARMKGPDADMSRLDFERWRARDPRNRAAYAEMEQISRLSRRLGETPLGQAHLAAARRRPLHAMPALRAAFALLAMLIVGTGAFCLWHSGEGRLGGAASVDGPVATRVGELKHVVLADGTAVTLDTDSAIAQDFAGRARIVRLLRGRARFDVAHQAGRPFLVEAGDRTIVDRGTLFDVVLGREGVKVTLLRGAVEVRAGRSAGPGVTPLARLVPGQVFVDAAAPDLPQVMPAPGGGDQWVKGMLSFDGAPLGQVVAEANRYSGHKIRLGAPKLAALHVTGTFRATPADALAAILAATFHLRVERTAQGDFILQQR